MQKNGKSKSSLVKNHILDSLENGTFKSGERLPGAKRIAAELKVSHAVVQSVIDSLVCEGILLTVPRGGSYVQKDWQERLLHTNITIFQADRAWDSGLRKLLNDYIPEMRLTSLFKESVFEIRTTTAVQAHHDEYMDLSELFNECFPDKSDLELKPFESFYFDDKLAGIPFIYSPRVMFYNPAVLAEADCPVPDNNWSWNDFLNIVKFLRNRIEPQRIIHWVHHPYSWMNFVARCGGSIINPKLADPVRLDSDETIQGLEIFRELGQLVNRGLNQTHFSDFFKNRNIAFYVGGRDCVPLFQKYGWKNWNAMPLPVIPGGVDTTMQATDLICIRKNCTNMTTAKAIIKLLLSTEFQDLLADLNYGIPIRKSSAAKSLDRSVPRDLLFLTEGAKVKREYNLNSPILYDMVSKGVEICLMSDMDMRPGMRQLADVIRTYIAIENNSWNISLKSKKET